MLKIIIVMCFICLIIVKLFHYIIKKQQNKKLLKILEKGVNQGDTKAMYLLGEMYHQNKNYDLAEMYLKMSTDQGDKAGLLKLILLYFEQKRFSEAEEYLKLYEYGKEQYKHFLKVFPQKDDERVQK